MSNFKENIVCNNSTVFKKRHYYKNCIYYLLKICYIKCITLVHLKKTIILGVSKLKIKLQKELQKCPYFKFKVNSSKKIFLKPRLKRNQAKWTGSICSVRNLGVLFSIKFYKIFLYYKEILKLCSWGSKTELGTDSPLYTLTKRRLNLLLTLIPLIFHVAESMFITSGNL